MALKVPVRRGPELLGWVRITGQDHYWTLGVFEPAAGFEPYRSLFEQLRDSSQRASDARDTEDCVASDEWHEALERINELGLSVGDPGASARDFKITDTGEVEFKWG